ncbi:hypothetical protein [Cupriavidus basilensis]|uniref:hypothetical protein n=1 Tax=Cupriavidus TaxID=106589 RepID=UPI0039F70F0D
MKDICVQFLDASEATVVSVFGAPQDPAAWSNLGRVPSDDPRYAAYYDSLPEMSRQFMVASGA